jgi:2-iminobutanoate/2-iminopropanoate deaminase
MVKQIIRTERAPASALYSQGVKVGPTVYVAGMAGLDPATKQMAGSTIQDQTRQALRNCEAVLAAAGGTLQDVVSVTVLLANPADWDGMNEVYGKAFAGEPPVRAVTRLGPELPNVLVSIAMIAHVEG